MRGEGLARRVPALEGPHRRVRLCRGALGSEFVLGSGGLELLELQLELVEQPRLALGARAVEGTPELLDLELLRGYQRLGVRQHRPLPCGLGRLRRGARLGRRKGGAEGWDLARLVGHEQSLSRFTNMLEQNHRPDHPAAEGRQVCRGLRQSIPSSR